MNGHQDNGNAGKQGPAGVGMGGGAAFSGTQTIANTTISGNSAATSDNNVYYYKEP
jgi:hypothetical protein